MAELQPLVEVFQSHGSFSSASSPPESVSDPSLQRAFRCLASLLAFLPSQLSHLQQQQEEEEAHIHEAVEVSNSPSEHHRHHWSPSQLDFVLNITEAAIVHHLYLPIEDGITEPVEGVFRNVVELCIKAFKHLAILVKTKQSLSPSDEQIYNKLLLLMELAVCEGKTKEYAPVCLNSSKELLQGLDTGDTVDVSSQKLTQSHGVDRFTNGSQETVEISEDIILLLASDEPLKLGVPDLEKCSSELSNMQSATQHFAVSCVGIHRELLGACGGLLANFDFESCEDGEKQVQIRLSLISRMLRLLCSLSKVASGFPYPQDLLNGLVELTALTPHLLMHEIFLKLEETDNQNCCYATFFSSVLALAEAVGLDNSLTQNLRLYIAASAVDILVAANKSKGGKGFSQQKLPVVLEPQVVSYIFGLIRAMHAHIWQKNFVGNLRTNGRSGNIGQALKLQLRMQDFDLAVGRSQSEMIQMVFPRDGAWLPNLLDGVNLLYTIGMEARPAAEKALLYKRDTRIGSPAETPALVCEEEALFGNLFSESSRQPSSNEAYAQSSVLENRQCVFRDTTLQAVVDVLTFLRDCIFCSGCQTGIFQSAQRHMNGEGIDLILEIFFRSSNEKVDVQASSDIVAQLSKGTFDLLNSIVGNGALSLKLEEHFLLRILEKGYTGCTVPNKTSVLLAKVLINHSSNQGSEQNDTLKLAVWKSFTDRVASSIRKGDWVDVPVRKAVASLPSIFYLEVLLMAFHSSSASARLSIIERVKFLVKNFCEDLQDLEGPCLSSCSLLFSRVVMGLRYMVMHYKTFPSWLLTDLKINLSQYTEEDGPRVAAEGFSLASVAATIGQGLKDTAPVGRQTGFSDGFLAQLYDINAFCNGDGAITEVFESVRELSDLCSYIRGFLDRWRGKVVNQVEELLVERYIFVLGWATVRDFGKHAHWSMPSDCSHLSGNLFGADFNLKLTQSLYSYFNQGQGKGSERDGADWWKFFMATLSRFEAVCRTSSTTKLALIDRSRQGSVLNLLLSFLQKGLEVFLADQDKSALPESQHEEVLVFCEQLVYNCISTGSLDQVLKLLSSLLSFYVESLHRSVLDMLGDSQMCEASNSSIHLVLGGGLSWTKQDQLFTRLGVSFSPLHTLLRRGMPKSWHAEMLSKSAGFGTMGTLEKLFLPSLLHGYPCINHPDSAMVISCISLIECMLETIRLFLKANLTSPGYIEGIVGQNALFTGLLDVLMVIKLEEIFESVHCKCEEVLCILLPSKEERARLCDLHLLKQKESLLKALSCNNEITEAVREELILHVVEVFSSIHLDPARNDVFREYFTSGGGSLSPLMDVLDGCFQETVNVKVLQFLMNVVGGETISQGGLRSELQEKLITTDQAALCLWLEQRLLGCTYKPAEGGLACSMSSNTVRDLMVGFLSGLVSPEFTLDGADLRTHLLNALLLSLERAFNSLDNGGLRSYFTLLLQLANKEPHLRHVLWSVTELVRKLPGQDGNTEGLKGLLTFLISLLNSCGDQRAQTCTKLTEGKHWPNAITRPFNAANRAKHSVPKKDFGYHSYYSGG